MLTRKCDICGAEMRITTPRYKVTFEGWFYAREKDICINCFKRIVEEIIKPDTPQIEIGWKERVSNESSYNRDKENLFWEIEWFLEKHPTSELISIVADVIEHKESE